MVSQLELKFKPMLAVIVGYLKKMPQRRDSAGAVCHSGLGIFFEEFDFGGVYLVLWATIHTYVKLNNSRLCI